MFSGGLAARTAVELRAHVMECDRRYAELAALQTLRHGENQNLMHGMEERLTKRLDKQDTQSNKLIWSAMIGAFSLVGILLYFVITHLKGLT